MLACKREKNSFLGSHYIETFTAMSDKFPNPNTYFIPILCQHCSNPSCVPACPKGVFTVRKDGIVAVGNTEVCKSCKDKPCVKACPYGAIDYDPVTGMIGKCDMCASLIDQGKTPACVNECLTNSLLFGDLDDPESTVSQLIASRSEDIHQLKPETGNKPNVYYILSKKEWKDCKDLYSPAWHNK